VWRPNRYGALRAPGSIYVLAVLAAPWLFWLAGCSRNLDYPPPLQKTMPLGQDPPRVRPVLRMSEPDADAFIVQDVLGSAGGIFRWTAEHPRFKLWLEDASDREFVVRFALIASNFRETGPVTVSVTINGRELAAPAFAIPREYEYRHPVPKAFLAGPSPAIVGLDISPVSVAKADGVKLGIYLESIGLLKTPKR
jgi:hypothetical protein